MIFSQLFSPNYKSSDPEKRIASIEKLNKEVEKDKSILHELAFNDGNENVSLAALDKLDSFILWMKLAETSTSARIKKHAQQVCISQLEDDTKVPEKLFLSVVKESHNKPFLELLLFTSARLQQHEQLIVDVLLLLNNVIHTRRFFQELASPAQQLTIVNETNDLKTLNRLLKYAKKDDVNNRINEKIAEIAELAEKPSKIKQQVSMINSRLLALKEIQDYEYLAKQLKQLSSEFETVKVEFTCIDELTRASMTEKYLALKIDIQQKLANLEEGHKSQLLLDQTTEDLSEILERCTQVQIQIDLITGLSDNKDTINSNIDAEVKILTSSLVDATTELEALNQREKTHAHSLKINKLASHISSMQTSLTQVFDIVEYAQKGMAIELGLSSLISSINDAKESSPKMSQNELAELRKQVNAIKDEFETLKVEAKGLLPAKTNNQFSKSLTNANKLIKRYGQQFKDIESKCDNKLKTVNRMIKDGKFKPAIATFSQAKRLFDEIGEHAPARLHKAYEQTALEIEKLQDWQSYIAQPRKPAILEKAQQLSESVFEDPYERTEQVKQLRQEWNSLGQLNTPEDDANNKAFDTHIEKAFVPCRAFFAELDRQRELNYQKALVIVEEAKALNTAMPASELTSKISALKNQFNKLGEIDKTKLNRTRREFTKVFKPLGNVISEEQNLNAEQKKALIKQAIKLNEETVDDNLLPEAIDKAKAFQQKWKQIGFAGKSLDNQLWNEFRKVNDVLFERFHQNINSKKNAQQQEFIEIDKEVNDLVSKVKAALTIADLNFYEQEQSILLAKIQALDEDIQRRLKQKLSKMEDVYSTSVNQLNKVRDESALSNLFAFLHGYDSQVPSEEFDCLLSRYKTWVNGDVASIELLEGLSRVALTQVAAILFDIAYNDVPIGDKALRQDLQLKMMASKLQGDDAFDTESVLAKWVSLGLVEENEKESLLAMEKMYIG